MRAWKISSSCVVTVGRRLGEANGGLAASDVRHMCNIVTSVLSGTEDVVGEHAVVRRRSPCGGSTR